MKRGDSPTETPAGEGRETGEMKERELGGWCQGRMTPRSNSNNKGPRAQLLPTTKCRALHDVGLPSTLLRLRSLCAYRHAGTSHLPTNKHVIRFLPPMVLSNAKRQITF